MNTTRIFSKPLRRAHTATILFCLLLTALKLTAKDGVAQAGSLRCPNAQIYDVELAEQIEIMSIWKSLDDSAPDGSDGPLGCPLGTNVEDASDIGWTGIMQKFQRGAILIGRYASTGTNLAVVRTLGGWTVWGTGLQRDQIASERPPSKNDPAGDAPAAAWGKGGYIFQALPSRLVALWRCTQAPCWSGNHWQRTTPLIEGLALPFDAAARLTIDDLTDPADTKFQERVNALFPDWLPCFTNLPSDYRTGFKNYVDEDNLARATIVMRRDRPCSLTGERPRSRAESWLRNLQFRSGQLPGTSSDGYLWQWAGMVFCRRDGELDVELVQLLHLVFQYQSVIDSETLDHLRDLLQPWGGKPRGDPYVTPDGLCLGFPIIESENHIMLQESARYLINALLSPRDLGPDFDNSANIEWLTRFNQQLVRRDFYEFNSLPYTRYQLKSVLALHDYAPDNAVKKSAQGVLNWLFTKQVFSSNLDRDHRPYRRRPEPDRYSYSPWWGSATTATTIASSLLIGPLAHIHSDLDLRLDDNSEKAIADLDHHPDLGAAGEYFVADCKYCGHHIPTSGDPAQLGGGSFY